MNEGTETEGAFPARSGFSEWFHTWRYFFWLLGLIALVMLFYAEENWRGEWAWEKHKQQMQARGERFESSAFIPPRVPDESNFTMTPFLQPIFDFIPGTQRWFLTNALANDQEFSAKYIAASSLVSSKKGPRLNSWVKGRTDLIQWAAAFMEPTNGPGRKKTALMETHFDPQEAAKVVLSSLSDTEPTIEEIRVATRRPFSRFNMRYQEDNPAGILLPHLAVLKHLSQVLQLRVAAELTVGQTNSAFDDLNLMLFLVDASREEPIVISQLVRFSLLQLALQSFADGLGRWSESQLQSLEERFQKYDFCSDTKRTLQAERVLFGGGIIDYIRRSPDKLQILDQMGVTGQTQQPSYGLALVLMAAAPNGWLYFEQLNYSRLFEEALLPTIDLTKREIRPKVSREAEARFNELKNHAPTVLLVRHRFFAGLLLPAASMIAQKCAFAQTGADQAAIACALERYHLANGKFPNSLESLVPRFISEIPHDLITGKPLHYRLTDDVGYVLYSVGWNETDDGGIVGVSNSGEGFDLKEGDWVWSGA